MHIVALPPPPQSSALVHFAAQACKARRSLCDARSLTTGPVGPRGAVPHGGVPEWLKGTDCKSVGDSLRWFKSNPLHQRLPDNRGYAGSLHTIDRAVVAHLDHSIAPETGMQLFSRTPVAGDYRTNRGEYSDAQVTNAGWSRALLPRAREVTTGEAAELSASAGGKHSSDQQAAAADAPTGGLISRGDAHQRRQPLGDECQQFGSGYCISLRLAITVRADRRAGFARLRRAALFQNKRA